MSVTDKEYTPRKYSNRKFNSGRRGRPTGLSHTTWVQTNTKDTIKIDLAKGMMQSRLAALNIDAQSDEGRAIIRATRNEVDDMKRTKEVFGDLYLTANQESNEFRYPSQRYQRFRSAERLMESLYSFTKLKTKYGLDEGDYPEDFVDLITGGDGWAADSLGRRDFRKHVNLAIDNSGSTYTSKMRYCSDVMRRVANSLLDTLVMASVTYPGISFMGLEFNKLCKVSEMFGKSLRPTSYQRIVESEYSNMVFYINEPDKEDARETNLAPLIQTMLEKEQANGLIGEPRLDIILTDGEFENQDDANLAGQLQRQRGPGVTTYLLNLCAGSRTNIALPPSFREIPLGVIDLLNPSQVRVEEEDLMPVLSSIVINEMTKEG